MLLAACGPRAAAPPEDQSPSAAAESSPTPLLPVAATPSPTPRLIPLTEAGCCAYAVWSDDGERIRFVDDPPGELPLGVYSVSPAGGEIRREGPDTADARAVLAMRQDATEARFRTLIPEEARSIRVASDGSRVAWTMGTTSVVNVDQRQRVVWTGDLGTGSSRPVATLIGGDLIGWSPEGRELIVTGALSGGGERGLWSLPVDGGPPRRLLAAERIRSPLLSPAGDWLVLFRAFEADPSQNGIWIVETDADRVWRIPGLASYRWRDANRLLYFPHDLDGGLQLLEFDVATGLSRFVAGPEAFPEGIGANDWSVSPTGAWLVYRSADDGALWALELESP